MGHDSWPLAEKDAEVYSAYMKSPHVHQYQISADAVSHGSLSKHDTLYQYARCSTTVYCQANLCSSDIM